MFIFVQNNKEFTYNCIKYSNKYIEQQLKLNQEWIFPLWRSELLLRRVYYALDVKGAKIKM